MFPVIGTKDLLVDVFYVIDSSADTSSPLFDNIKKFVLRDIRKSAAESSAYKVAVVNYGATADTVSEFELLNNYNDKAKIITSMTPIGGVRRTDLALRLLYKDLFPKSERGRKKHVMIFVTGNSTVINGLEALSRAMQKMDAVITVVAIGDNIDYAQLDDIASSYNRIFQFSSGDQLIDVVDEFAVNKEDFEGNIRP